MAGRYQAYPEYRDSGVEWLGEVPAHWALFRLKYIVELINKKVDSAIFDVPYTGLEHIESWTGNRISSYVTPLIEGQANLYRKGDVLFGKLRPYLAKVHAADENGTCSSELLVLRPKTVKQKFLMNYLLNRSFVDTVDSSTYGAKMPRASWDFIGNLPTSIPPLNEQQAILDFLDQETAKIDTLIEKQQRLISLLKEKRQAVISHAVTKGLNPDAPMKDSGVEWLGEVPEHWKVIKFSHCTSIRNGQVDPKIEPYCDFILIAPNHIESKTGQLLSTETAAYQGADSGKYLCKQGEVIYSKIRPALTKVCLSPSDETICSADMYPIQAMYGLTNRFLYWTLLSDWFTCLAVLESDRVAMPKINREKLAEVKLLVPPSDEQLKICLYVFKKTESIDNLIEKTAEGIELSKEHRTALISAAVTGKIDVRNWQPPSNNGNVQ